MPQRYHPNRKYIIVDRVDLDERFVNLEHSNINKLNCSTVGGIFEAYIITKGNGVSVEIPEDAKEWLSIVSIDQKGTDACVKFRAARNEGGDRSTSITFRTTDGKKDYTSKTELSQQGAIVEATVAEFIAAEVGDQDC